jgi:hypothetical protein
MKRFKQQRQSHSPRLLPWLRNLLLVLPVVFAANGASAQQSVQGAPAPTSAGQPAAPATANPAITQAHVSAAAPSPGVEQIATSQKSDGSLHQGLTVHGHWVINVREPDGTLVEHREFENSLQPGGAGMLVGLLSGYMVPGDWMIVLGPGNNGGLSACVGPLFPACGLVHNISTYPAISLCGSVGNGSGFYCTGSVLSYTYNLIGVTGVGSGSIVLNGTITANQTGQIGQVQTILSACANIPSFQNVVPSSVETNSPASCPPQGITTNPFYPPFTNAFVTPAIPVTSGQQIQVIVTITFS